MTSEPLATEAPGKSDIAVYEAVRAHELMLNQATGAFEHAVLAPLYLLNGGGAIALLTLAGAASGDEPSLSVHTGVALVAVAFWVAGLLAAVAATWWGYRVQRGFAIAGRWRRQRIELQFLDLSEGVHRLVVTKAPGPASEPLSPDDIDLLVEKLDENTKEHEKWWGELRPWFERYVGFSVAFFALGATAAGVAVVA